MSALKLPLTADAPLSGTHVSVREADGNQVAFCLPEQAAAIVAAVNSAPLAQERERLCAAAVHLEWVERLIDVAPNAVSDELKLKLRNARREYKVAVRAYRSLLATNAPADPGAAEPVTGRAVLGSGSAERAGGQASS